MNEASSAHLAGSPGLHSVTQTRLFRTARCWHRSGCRPGPAPCQGLPWAPCHLVPAPAPSLGIFRLLVLASSGGQVKPLGDRCAWCSLCVPAGGMAGRARKQSRPQQAWATLWVLLSKCRSPGGWWGGRGRRAQESYDSVLGNFISSGWKVTEPSEPAVRLHCCVSGNFVVSGLGSPGPWSQPHGRGSGPPA